MIFALDEELVLANTGAGGKGNIVVAATGVLLDTGDTDIEEEVFSCNVIFLVVDVIFILGAFLTYTSFFTSLIELLAVPLVCDLKKGIFFPAVCRALDSVWMLG